MKKTNEIELINKNELLAHLEDWRKNWEQDEDSCEKNWTITAIDYFTNLINTKTSITEAKIKASIIDVFVEKLKKASIRGAFEYKPDKEKPWYKVRSYCKVVGTRKINEIAKQLKEGEIVDT